MSYLDSCFSGIIVIFLLFAIWKYYNKQTTYTQSIVIMACGCPVGKCKCRSGFTSNTISGDTKIEDIGENGPPHGVAQVISSGPQPIPGADMVQDYQEATKIMGVEQSVGDSHTDWCSSLTKNGIPTGASSCTTLEETGRSYGTADFVGLTSRKWCKARQLATPADDSRITPSHDVIEYCNIDMDELI